MPLIVIGVMMLLAAVTCAHSNGRDLLWRLVHSTCVPNQVQHADPDPCETVNLREGYVILKDPRGLTQYLLIPTVQVTGIESASLLAPGAPNYFADAWRERGYVERAARRALPRSAISLAINSTKGRTQDQLHIHIACIRTDIQKALRRELPVIGFSWKPLPEALVAGHHYRAMRIVADTLDESNPFLLLADGAPSARAVMGKQTLVVTGSEFASGQLGFIILNDEVDLASGDMATGEELQDHHCRIASS